MRKVTKVEPSYCGEPMVRPELSMLFESQLDGDDRDRGALEALERGASTQARAFGELVARLVSHGLLDGKDVTAILNAAKAGSSGRHIESATIEDTEDTE